MVAMFEVRIQVRNTQTGQLAFHSIYNQDQAEWDEARARKWAADNEYDPWVFSAWGCRLDFPFTEVRHARDRAMHNLPPIPLEWDDRYDLAEGVAAVAAYYGDWPGMELLAAT
jgi:hypothetical protein